MSALREAMSHAVLGWVKPELDQTLRQVRGEIESFAENPADSSRMQMCVGYLHQVQGTLHMVELYAPAMVAEELEKLAQALQEGRVADPDEACATLMRGTVLLPDYLERLQGGHRDIPIVLLPLLNDIRAARGEAGLSESVLFAPDLERPLPQEVPSTEPMPGGTRDARLAQACEHLERVLAGWPEDGTPADPGALVPALTTLQRLAEHTAARRMLWVAGCVAEALRDGALQPTPALHQGFSGVLRAVRQVRQGLVPGAAPGQEPTRQLLYQVAHSAARHPALEDLRKAFDLQAASPSQAEIEHARSSISGRNRALLDTVGGAVKEELMRVKDVLDLQLRTNADIAGLAPQVTQLGSVADTLGMMGLGLARNVVLQQRQSLAELVEGRRACDESALLDIAGALLYVDASLDDQVAHLGDGSAPDAQAAESQRTVEALAGEAIRNFAQARQQFVAFIETGWEHAQLDTVPRLLGEVGGALRMLELSAPADYVEGVGRYIGTELVERRRVPGGVQLDTLADAMASLEYYLEALREHRPNREEILDITRSSLESLRYWPLPVPGTGEPAGETLASPVADATPLAFEPEFTPDPAQTTLAGDLDIERGPALPAFVPAADTASAFDPVAGEFEGIGSDDQAQIDAAFAAPSGESSQAAATQVEAPFEAPFEVTSPEGDAAEDIGQSAALIEAFEAVEASSPSAALPPAVPEPAPAVEQVPSAADAAAVAQDTPSLQGGFDLGGSHDIDDEIREVFLEEFDEEIDNLRQMLPAWVANVDNMDRLRPIRRVFHTLKGSGRLVGASLLGEFAWKVENMLNRVLDGSRPATPAVVALLQQATDTLPQLNAALRGQPGARADLAGIEAVADRLAAGEEALYSAPGAATAAAPVAEQPALDDFVPDLDGTPAAVDSVLREILETEVGNHLRSVDAWLASVQSVQAGPASDPLLRAFHTMNGAFAMADVPEITEITGRAEQYVKRLLANGVPASAAGVAGLAAAAQAIRTTIAALQSAQPRIPQFAELRAQLSALGDALPQLARPVSTLVDDRSQHTYAGQGAQQVYTPDVPSSMELTGAMDLSRFLDHPAELPQDSTERPVAEQAGPAPDAADIQAPDLSADGAVPPAPLPDDGQAAWFDLRLEYRTEPKWTDAPAPTSADAQVTAGQAGTLDPAAVAAAAAESAPLSESIEAHAERDASVDVQALSPQALPPTAGDDAAEADSWNQEPAAVEPLAPDWSDTQAAAEESTLAGDEALEAGVDIELTPTEAAAEAMDLAEHLQAAPEAPALLASTEVAAPEPIAEAETPPSASGEQPAGQDLIDTAEVHAEPASDAGPFDMEATTPDHTQADAQAPTQAPDAEAATQGEAAVETEGPLSSEADLADAESTESLAAQNPAPQEEPARDALHAPFVDLPETAAPAAGLVGEDAASTHQAPAAVPDAAMAGSAFLAAQTDHRHTESVAPEAELAASSAQDAPDLPPIPETTETAAMAEQMLDFTVLDRDLVDIFVEEGNDLLDHSDGLLARLRGAPDDRGLVIGLQRDLHTIKGGARMAGIEPIGDLGHAIESLLEQIAEHRAEVDRDVLGLLERGFDALHGMLARTAAYCLATPRPELVAEFDARARGEPTGATGPDQALRGTAVDLVEPLDLEISHAFATPDDAQATSLDEVGSVEASPPVSDTQGLEFDSAQADTTWVSDGSEHAQDAAPAPADGPQSASATPASESSNDEFLDAELLAALDAAWGPSDGNSADAAAPQAPAAAAPDVQEPAAPAVVAAADAGPLPESAPVPVFVPAVPPPLVPQPIPALPPLSAPIELEATGEDEHAPLGSGQEQVRVRADLLDRLVNHAGEVAIYRARLEQQMGAFRAAMAELDRTNIRLHDQLRRLDLETEAQIVARYQREQDTRDTAFDPLELDRFSTLQQLSRALAESAADLSGLQGVLDDLARQNDSLLGQQSRVSSELQDGLMRARMVPFEGSVPRLRRVLRQAAADTGKQAQLQLEGAHGELDRNVLERMTAPLEHLLRNAVAHGLETPQARREAGKPEEGVVRVVLRREGSEMVLQVADDGAGIDHAAIRRRAEQRGMLPVGAEVADIDLERLILEPGFSTAEEVSQLAGRGVGMDVVHNEVRQLGGSLEISSTRGQGTTFTLRLPQTLAVTQAVFVRIGETQFAVPVAAVGGVGRISRARFEAADASYVYGGEAYALHDLGTLVGLGPARAEGQPQVPLLLVRAGELRAAVAVDQVLGNREIVVKPVGPQIGSIPGIYGATITGDGSVVVILDAAPLVRRYIAQPALAGTAATPAEQRQVPLVMVVDDSLTMRKVTSRVLERHNFEVSTARDGVEALERLEERVPDLMLLDIEMPRMDGYELATAMKADPRLAGVPIVMITSRTGEKHRQRALEIGVQRYMGKPYQELDLMRNVYDLLGIARVRD
jgi:chemosensory pili system protein ChpA (sensor histidine kinase/response regulator)